MTFLQARNYTPANRTKVDYLVLHSMEAPEKGSTAEDVANYFHNTSVRASANVCFDDNSAVECVHDEDIAWHCPGLNHNGLGLEHAGYARQTRAEWQDPFSEAMLHISARWGSKKAVKFAIPLQFVNAEGLKNGVRGVTTHQEGSVAFTPGGHWDPGPGFPMDHYLSLLRFYSGQGTVIPAPPPLPQALQMGAKGDAVKFLQGMLNILKPYRRNPQGQANVGPIDADGNFGPQTAAGVMEFQRWLNGVLAMSGGKARAVNGVVDPALAAAMAYWVPLAVKENLKVHPGDSGKGLTIIQAALNNCLPYLGKGAKPLSVNGIYDGKTVAAMLAFKAFVNGMLALGKKPAIRVDNEVTDYILGQLGYWSGVATKAKR